MKSIGIITARKGSKGLPNKNKLLLLGKPLFEWTIQAAINSKSLTNIILFSDDEDIVSITSEKYPTVQIVPRPAEVSGDKTTHQETIKYVIDHLEYISPEDIIIILQPTSPQRTNKLIDNAIECFFNNKKSRDIDGLSTYQISDGCYGEKLYKLEHENDSLFMVPCLNKNTSLRQECTQLYKENGAIFIQTVKSFINGIKMQIPTTSSSLSAKTVIPMITDIMVDIDTQDDLLKVSDLMSNNIIKNRPRFMIGDREIGPGLRPFVIVEIGINHEGSIEKAKQMVRDAKLSGAECVKFQCHVIEDEMANEAKETIPGNADVSIYEIMSRCAFNLSQEEEIMNYVKDLGLIYMSTPFSRAAADRLESMGVEAYKIGSGECNNYPLIKHIASFGKPVIISTGMNDIASVSPAVDIFRNAGIPFVINQCTSMYPTPYNKVHLNGLNDIKKHYPDAILGLSCHSMGIWTCFGAQGLGACVFEKHFTSNLNWEGPDVPISITPQELKDLIVGLDAIWKAIPGEKKILHEEQVTIDFAYASVVTIAPVKKGEAFTSNNTWVKRPGTGDFMAKDYDMIISGDVVASKDLESDVVLRKTDIK